MTQPTALQSMYAKVITEKMADADFNNVTEVNVNSHKDYSSGQLLRIYFIVYNGLAINSEVKDIIAFLKKSAYGKAIGVYFVEYMESEKDLFRCQVKIDFDTFKGLR